MQETDSALLVKHKCLRKDFDGEGKDLMGILKGKKSVRIGTVTLMEEKRLIVALRQHH